MCLEILQNRCLPISPWFAHAPICYGGWILVFSLDLIYIPLGLADSLYSVYRYVVLSSFIRDEASFSGFVCFYFGEFQGVKYSTIFSRSRHGSLDQYSANYSRGG